MRKYKQVKEKKITYAMPEWEVIEKRASDCKLKTGTYIREASVNGAVSLYSFDQLEMIVPELRIISQNINQVAKKANETSVIHDSDMESLRSDLGQLNSILSVLISSISEEVL